jgi:drug/metabolite transporter (DMT)-like permease
VVPIADATAISFLTPVIVPVLAIFLLAEPPRPARFLALAVGFVGALVILRPGFQEISPEMAMLLGSATVMAGFTLIVRSASRDHSSETIVFYTLIASQPLALLIAIPDLDWPSARGWALLLGIGVFASLGQITATLGYGSGAGDAVRLPPPADRRGDLDRGRRRGAGPLDLDRRRGDLRRRVVRGPHRSTAMTEGSLE